MAYNADRPTEPRLRGAIPFRYVGVAFRRLGELFLQCCEGIEVTEGSLLRSSVGSSYSGSCILLASLTLTTLCTFASTSLSLCFVFEGTAV